MQSSFLMQTIGVLHPTKDDILFGRQSQCWNHEGNRRFRAIVSNYQDDYHSARARAMKVAIVAKIVNEVRQNGARFLKRDERMNRWYEVDRKVCIEKVGHAIRDRQAIARRSLHGRQEQYLKTKPSVEAEELDETPTNSNEPSSKSVADLIPSKNSPSQEELMLPKRKTVLPLLSSEPPVDSLKDALLLSSTHQDSTVVASRLALIRYNREAEAAARKLVAAEDLYTSIRKQRALEGELAMLRRRNSFLMTAIAAEPTKPYVERLDSLSSTLPLLPQRFSHPSLTQNKSTSGAFSLLID